MLMGDEIVIGGNVYLNGYDVKIDLKMVSNCNFFGFFEKWRNLLERVIVI